MSQCSSDNLGRLMGRRLVLWGLLLAMGDCAHAGVLYEDTLFPTDLVSQATFPSRPYELSTDKTQLLFNPSHPGGQYLEVLLKLKITGTGTIAGALVGPAEVFIEIDSPPPDGQQPGTDWDLLIGITDGTDSVGFYRADNDGGKGVFHEARFLGDHLIDESFTGLFTGSGTPDVFSVRIGLESGQTTVDGTIGAMSGTHIGSRTVSVGNDIWLIVVGQDQPEKYAIERGIVRSCG